MKADNQMQYNVCIDSKEVLTGIDAYLSHPEVCTCTECSSFESDLELAVRDPAAFVTNVRTSIRPKADD